jgi:single-strand DNA-binding protein
MNSLRNSVRLIGRLGVNPEVKDLESGKKVAHFTLATNEVYKNQKGEKVEDTSWHKLVLWGKTAEIAQKFLEKGMEVAIEGRLTSRSYNSKDGEKKFVTEIIVGELLMLGKKN